MQDSELIEQIEKIEELSEKLELDLKERKRTSSLEGTENQNKVSVGDWVEIKNPKKGQESEGRIVRKNSLTVTVEAKGSKKKINSTEKEPEKGTRKIMNERTNNYGMCNASISSLKVLKSP